MTIDKAALLHLESRSIAAHDIPATFVPVRAIPGDMAIVSLEPYLAGRVRYRGQFTTHSITDAARYAARHAGGDCYIDQESMRACLFFNLMEDGAPGHGDHRAVLSLDKTAPFIALLQQAGKKLAQKELAEWLEDWRDHLVAFLADGTAIDINRAVAAVRRVTISAKAEATHTEENFRGSRSAMEEIEARSEQELPAGFRFTCIPYHGLDERSFELRMSVITSDPPALILRHVRLEEQQEAMAQEFADKLETALKSAGAEADVYIGSFTP